MERLSAEKADLQRKYGKLRAGATRIAAILATTGILGTAGAVGIGSWGQNRLKNELETKEKQYNALSEKHQRLSDIRDGVFGRFIEVGDQFCHVFRNFRVAYKSNRAALDTDAMLPVAAGVGY